MPGSRRGKRSIVLDGILNLVVPAFLGVAVPAVVGFGVVALSLGLGLRAVFPDDVINLGL
jgi:hypothetical protein